MGDGANVGIRDIAEAAGVAPSTVSLVLNDKGTDLRIAPATQVRIRKIAQELNYRPIKRGSSAKRTRGELFCVLWPTDFEKGPLTPFFTGVFRYIQEHDLPYEVVMVPYENGELAKKTHIFEQGLFAGAMLMGLHDADIRFLESRTFGIPLVAFNREILGLSSVVLDDYHVGQFAFQHFYQRGHRSFCVISPNYSSKALSLRTVGFLDEAMAFEDCQLLPVLRKDNSSRGGYCAVEHMLSCETVPTAVFVANDNMIVGVVHALEDHAIHIPREIEIISFGDNASNQFVRPSVTSFALPVEEMAYDCVQILQYSIERQMDMAVNKRHMVTCVFRESCPQEGVFTSLK